MADDLYRRYTGPYYKRWEGINGEPADKDRAIELDPIAQQLIQNCFNRLRMNNAPMQHGWYEAEDGSRIDVHVVGGNRYQQPVVTSWIRTAAPVPPKPRQRTITLKGQPITPYVYPGLYLILGQYVLEPNPDILVDAGPLLGTAGSWRLFEKKDTILDGDYTSSVCTVPAIGNRQDPELPTSLLRTDEGTYICGYAAAVIKDVTDLIGEEDDLSAFTPFFVQAKLVLLSSKEGEQGYWYWDADGDAVWTDLDEDLTFRTTSANHSIAEDGTILTTTSIFPAQFSSPPSDITVPTYEFSRNADVVTGTANPLEADGYEISSVSTFPYTAADVGTSHSESLSTCNDYYWDDFSLTITNKTIGHYLENRTEMAPFQLTSTGESAFYFHDDKTATPGCGGLPGARANSTGTGTATAAYSFSDLSLGEFSASGSWTGHYDATGVTTTPPDPYWDSTSSGSRTVQVGGIHDVDVKLFREVSLTYPASQPIFGDWASPTGYNLNIDLYLNTLVTTIPTADIYTAQAFVGGTELPTRLLAFDYYYDPSIPWRSGTGLYTIAPVTVDGATVIMAFWVKDRTDSGSEYEIEFWGLYNGVVTELTSLFMSVDASLADNIATYWGSLPVGAGASRQEPLIAMRGLAGIATGVTGDTINPPTEITITVNEL